MIDLPLLLALLVLFQIKHYLADFYWQTGWMIAGKARYGSPGGLAHAGLHGAMSVPVLVLTGAPIAACLVVAAIEAAVHYHIDWAKARLQVAGALTPESPRYWHLLGADQAAHQLSYIAMIWAAAAVSSRL